MLKVTAAAERALWAMVRAAIAAGGHLRRIGEGVAQELRPEPQEAAPDNQLRLWVVDGAGLPARPWRLPPSHVFRCLTLGCTLQASECVRRQRESDGAGTLDTWRGQAATYPSCQTKNCAQGRGVRAAVGPDALVQAQGAHKTSTKGFALRRRSKGDLAQQDAARRAKERVGLLGEPRILDVDDDPVPE